MLKMKKILAILLAVCFLVSITAASASAYEEKKVVTKEKVVVKKTVVEKEKKFGDRDEREHGKEKKFGDRRERKQGWGEREHGWGERENHRFNDHHKKRHHHPAHWEKKRFGHREFRNNHWQTVFVYKMVYVAEFYDYHFY